MTRPDFDDAAYTELPNTRPQISAPPCEDGCPHRPTCALGAACLPLHDYCDSGVFDAAAPREPSRKIYQRLFSEPVIGRHALSNTAPTVPAKRSYTQQRLAALVEGHGKDVRRIAGTLRVQAALRIAKQRTSRWP